jgi:hypothetical protein
MSGKKEIVMNISNEDIKRVLAEIPEGHKHLRTKILLHDNTELIFQEATIANIVRAYITVKTHPQKKSLELKGKKLKDHKPEYAGWQLIEE